MNPRARPAALLLAAALTTVGCGSPSVPTGSAVSSVPPPSLATSLATTSGTWAVTVMGGSAASHNNFWQLFVRPSGTSTWHLVTPPGVASNGGLVVTSPGTGPVVAGFRPSQNLTYSPLAITRDKGATWTPGLLDAGLADVPDALAAAPSDGRLLALLTSGEAELSGPSGTAWMKLASRQTLAASAAGRRCRVDGLTGTAFSPSGSPLLAAACAHAGTVGIFSQTAGSWHLAGPTLPGSYARQPVNVLRLTAVAKGIRALLTAGAGSATCLIAASADGDGHWSLSPPLPLSGATVNTASFGTNGTAAVTLNGNRAQILTAAAGPWRPLPPLPPGTATIAQGPAAGWWDALAVHGTRLTIWQLAPRRARWAATQTIRVPIQFGSSS